jgi:hypothetical protein
MRFAQVPVFSGGVRTADRIISLPVFRVPGIRRLRDSNSSGIRPGEISF